MRPRAAVFCLHDVVPAAQLDAVPASHRPYVLTPEELRTLLLAAAETGRRAVPVSGVPGELGGAFYSLSFDDGAASDYAEVFPVLRELGLRATFFVVPTLVETPGHVTWPQLREMVAAGMEIGSHSLTHPFLDRLDRAGVVREYRDSKAVLEDRLGIAVRTASLPRGWASPVVRPVLEELGYRVFCTSKVGWWYPGSDPLDIPRVGVRRGMTAEEFAAIVQGARRALWPLQAVDLVKAAAKTCLGADAWQRVRAPLLAHRHRVGGGA